MDKLNFHFALLGARFPEFYQEAMAKEWGGVNRNDIMSDWLLELHWRRIMQDGPKPNDPNSGEYHGITLEEPEQDNDTSDFEAARNAMEGLKD